LKYLFIFREFSFDFELQIIMEGDGGAWWCIWKEFIILLWGIRWKYALHIEHQSLQNSWANIYCLHTNFRWKSKFLKFLFSCKICQHFSHTFNRINTNFLGNLKPIFLMRFRTFYGKFTWNRSINRISRKTLLVLTEFCEAHDTSI
jgi:hypothetical protein